MKCSVACQTALPPGIPFVSLRQNEQVMHIVLARIVPECSDPSYHRQEMLYNHEQTSTLERPLLQRT